MSRRLSRSLSIVASIAFVAALTAVTSGAITPGEAFSISPSQGAPFTVIAVAGANCIGQAVHAELEDLTGDDLPGGTGAIPAANVFVVATPDGAGNWSATITVPPVVAAGQYRVVASCGTDAYAPQPFQVQAGDLASISVSPTTATTGTDVLVNASGTLCRGAGAQADVGIFEAGAQSDDFVARMVVAPDGTGSWSAQLVLPATTPAGTYRVGVQCNVAGRQFFLYVPPPTIQLLALAAPTFTG
jgi:hypothetical protein